MSAPDDGADVERSEVITLADAAERLSVSPRTIRRFISEGSLSRYRISGHRGRLVRVDVADVDALSPAHTNYSTVGLVGLVKPTLTPQSQPTRSLMLVTDWSHTSR
jgi:excisionase family DNA binding protein